MLFTNTIELFKSQRLFEIRVGMEFIARRDVLPQNVVATVKRNVLRGSRSRKLGEKVNLAWL